MEDELIWCWRRFTCVCVATTWTPFESDCVVWLPVVVIETISPCVVGDVVIVVWFDCTVDDVDIWFAGVIVTKFLCNASCVAISQLFLFSILLNFNVRIGVDNGDQRNYFTQILLNELKSNSLSRLENLS